MIKRGLRFVRRYGHVNWTMLDQVVVSAANFAVTVLLARYLEMEEFGWFTLFWLEVFYIRALQGALVVSPMLSIGPKYAAEAKGAYFGAVLIQHLGIAAIATFFLTLGMWVAGHYVDRLADSHLIFGLAAFALADQLQDFSRKSFFAQNRQRIAFFCDALCYGSRLLGLGIAMRSEEVSLFQILWVMAVPSGLFALVGLRLLGGWKWDRRTFKDVMKRHWGFSKWVAVGAVLEGIVGNFYALVASTLLGITALGVIRASESVLGPAQVLHQGLCNLVPVQASRHYSQGGSRGLRAYLRKASLLGGGATVCIALIACAQPEFWLGLLYGEKFNQYAYMVYWQGFWFIAISLALPLQAGLRAIEDTRPLFISTVIQDAVAFIFAYPLVKWFGLSGMMVTRLCADTLAILVLGKQLSRRLRVLARTERRADFQSEEAKLHRWTIAS